MVDQQSSDLNSSLEMPTQGLLQPGKLGQGINGMNNEDEDDYYSTQVESSNAVVNQARPTGRYSGSASMNYYNNQYDGYNNCNDSKKKKKDLQKYVFCIENHSQSLF